MILECHLRSLSSCCVQSESILRVHPFDNQLINNLASEHPLDFELDFDPAAEGVLERVRAALVPDAGAVRAELHKLNLYTTGGHFKAHQDTPRGGPTRRALSWSDIGASDSSRTSAHSDDATCLRRNDQTRDENVSKHDLLKMFNDFVAIC